MYSVKAEGVCRGSGRGSMTDDGLENVGQHLMYFYIQYRHVRLESFQDPSVKSQ